MSTVQAIAQARTAPGDAALLARAAQAALASGQEELALPLLANGAQRAATNPRLWQWTGLLQRALDDRVAAITAFDRAATLAPRDALIAHGRARVALEAGLPAVDLFETARRLAPNDGEILLGLAAAYVAAGAFDMAEAFLDDLLAAHPGWIDGHEALSRLRWTMGDRQHYAASYRRALQAAPRDAALWQALVILTSHSDDFAAALVVIEEAWAAIGEQDFLTGNAAVAWSELGEIDAADTAFARIRELPDMTLAVRFVRHVLRNGRIEQAVAAIEPWLVTPEADLMWPYAALAWRLTGDPRWRWLEGDPRLVSVIDLADRLPPLDRLAAVLRTLHTAHGEQLDQSVRGGTQTDGALFQRIEPEIAALRRTVAAAVEAHVAALPPLDRAHPTLAPRRDRRVRFAGSWSVRLKGHGRHANHIHPAGWLSSALYVALPPDLGGDGHAGWLTLGSPQTELGLDLPPVRLVEPKPGRLVLFPSTMWHGTQPFADGERLTIAFDVARPL